MRTLLLAASTSIALLGSVAFSAAFVGCFDGAPTVTTGTNSAGDAASGSQGSSTGSGLTGTGGGHGGNGMSGSGGAVGAGGASSAGGTSTTGNASSAGAGDGSSSSSGAGGEGAPCLYAEKGCGPGLYCKAPGCGSGTCAKRPTSVVTLDTGSQPVCGCNKVTYWNSDYAAYDGMATEAALGPCPSAMAVPCSATVPCAGGTFCNRAVSSPGQCDKTQAGTCWKMPIMCPLGQGPMGKACSTLSCQTVCDLVQSQNPWVADKSCF